MIDPIFILPGAAVGAGIAITDLGSGPWTAGIERRS